MKSSGFWVVGWKFTKSFMSYLKPKSQFFFKLCITLQCQEIWLFCTFLAATWYHLGKRSPSKCSILDFWLFKWNFTKLVLWEAPFFKVCTISAKKVQRLCLMTLKSGAKFEEKLICCFKNDKNLENFDPSTPKSQK